MTNKKDKCVSCSCANNESDKYCYGCTNPVCETCSIKEYYEPWSNVSTEDFPYYYCPSCHEEYDKVCGSLESDHEDFAIKMDNLLAFWRRNCKEKVKKDDLDKYIEKNAKNEVAFIQGLEELVAKCDLNKTLDVPAYVLADYLNGCLTSFASSIKMREEFLDEEYERPKSE